MKSKKLKTHLSTYSCKISSKKGGGLLNFSVLQDDSGNVIEYSMAYINHMITTKDNGRVLGYDNAHGIHHRHCLGKYEKIEFISYEETLKNFEHEWRTYYEKLKS